MNRDQVERMAEQRLKETGREQVILYRKKTGEYEVFDKRQRMPQRYMTAFVEGLDTLMERTPFTGVESRVLYRLLVLSVRSDSMILMQANYAGIAKGLGMAKQNFGRALKKFRDIGVLVLDEEGNEFVNTALFYKGSSKDLEGKHRRLYDQGVKALAYLKIDLEEGPDDPVEDPEASQELHTPTSGE